MTARIITGDVLAVLPSLPAGSVQTCVTSPPYWGLRDYGVAGQLGLEATPEEYVARMVEVFREVRRVLRDDGTLWLNLGDSYANDGKWGGSTGGKHVAALHGTNVGRGKRETGLKPKDLVGVPWRVAFAIQADGWWLRSDIIWHKPNPMPESVTDRPTRAHEYVFLLSKAERYYYDAAAIREPIVTATGRPNAPDKIDSPYGQGFTRRARAGNKARRLAEGGAGDRPADHLGRGVPWEDDGTGRNARSVWSITTRPFKGAHFATMPPALARRCILAGSRPGDTVLDPFGGAGTTGLVAERHGRSAILVELNADYARLAAERIGAEAPLFASEAAD